MRKLLLSFCIAISSFMTLYAQDQVTLVVSGIADNKQDAINVALRSAIEQAYGVFVSSNTQILNDEIVRDEIVSLSRGNIKNFKELSSIVLSSGKIDVTVQATVSISKLVSYTQSKGASAELAGSSFGANMKLYELNKKNEQAALDHLAQELSMHNSLFDYKMSMSEPMLKRNALSIEDYWNPIFKSENDNDVIINIDIDLFPNDNTQLFCETFYASLGAIAIPYDEVNAMKSMGVDIYSFKDVNRVQGFSQNYNLSFRNGLPLLFRQRGDRIIGLSSLLCRMVKVTVADNTSSPNVSQYIRKIDLNFGTGAQLLKVKNDHTCSKLNQKKAIGHAKIVLLIPAEKISEIQNIEVIELPSGSPIPSYYKKYIKLGDHYYPVDRQ